MALKTYVGARYAPRFMGAWDRANEYAALSVVYHDNQSYVSRKTVPAETEITNTGFWIRSSDWNAQVDEYRNQVDAYDEKVVQYNQNVEAYNAAANQFFDETIHAYNTKEDMVNDESVKVGYTLITCGETAIGDGGGSFYQVVEETSSGAVALKNGLFAKKFQLMPERFNRYVVNSWGDAADLPLVKGDIVTNLNYNNDKSSDVYLPTGIAKTVKLFGIINSAEYCAEHSSITTECAITGNFRYFYVKVNDEKYLAFKILRFTFNYESLNNEGYSLPIYLLPHDICTNHLPCGKISGIDFYIGARSDAQETYIVKMPATPSNQTVINVMRDPNTRHLLTVTSYPNDYYVTIRYKGATKTISAISTAPLPPTAGVSTIISENDDEMLSLTEIGGSFCTLAVNVKASTTSLDINFGNCGTAYSIEAKSYFNNRTVLIPFNNTTGASKKLNVTCTWYQNTDVKTTAPITVSIPNGRSLFAAGVMEKGPNNLTMDQLL